MTCEYSWVTGAHLVEFFIPLLIAVDLCSLLPIFTRHLPQIFPTAEA